MGIGLSGMISGLDTDSMVKAMVSGQQLKATKIENKITLCNICWKRGYNYGIIKPQLGGVTYATDYSN